MLVGKNVSHKCYFANVERNIRVYEHCEFPLLPTNINVSRSHLPIFLRSYFKQFQFYDVFE